MATVSGRILFDRARTANPPTGMTGIANVPVVLQDTATGIQLAVITDINGNYSFINVPNGTYAVVEAFGTPGVTSPGDFNTAVGGPLVSAVVPPISYAQNPPTGATNLDCTSPNTQLITISGTNVINLYICNGPVRYTPIAIDPSVIVDWSINYINTASSGSFGFFTAGTPVMTGANPNPYPGMNPSFTYELPVPNSSYPNDGQFTIQNIATSITYQNNNVWWRIADHTTGNETGRMMIVNGDYPNSVFFRDIVYIKPHTYYLFITWILNLIKITGRTDPELGVIILAPDGSILYNQSLGESIPVNSNEPEWQEIGTIISSEDYSTLEVQFVSLGPAASGNDYAIDDIGFYEVEVTLSKPIKSASPTTVSTGDTVNITVSFTNDTNLSMTSVGFKDSMPDGLTFVPGSLTINGVICTSCDPNVGFALPDLNPGDGVEIMFEAIADHVPWGGIATNTALVTYSLPLVVDVPPPTVLTSPSNSVNITIMPPWCQFDFAILQQERNIQDQVAYDDIITFDTPLISAGAINYQPNGTIDITQPGVYLGAWFTSGMVGFATNGQLYKLKKFDYAISNWADLAGAGNHTKNSSTPGFAVINVTQTEIDEYGQATIALFNGADANIQLSFFNPKASILVYGANFQCFYEKIQTIESSLLEIANHILDLEQFLNLSDVIEIWSETPELLGLGAAVIHTGHIYNFWGIGELSSDQILEIDINYYLIESSQYSALAYYQGIQTVGTLWIDDPIQGLSKYPLRFDATGIYIIPDLEMNISSGTKFTFTLLLML